MIVSVSSEIVLGIRNYSPQILRVYSLVVQMVKNLPEMWEIQV